MNSQDGQEFLERQEAKAEIADELFTLCEAHQDKWGLTYDKQITQTLAQDSSRQVARRAGKPV